MEALVILVIVVTCSIASFWQGHVLTKKNEELKLIDAEKELTNKIGEAMKRASYAEKNYQELSSQIKAMASSDASVDEFNKLWQKIHNQLSTR